MRSEFRFPRSAIFLMSLTLVGVFLAIDTGRDLQLAPNVVVLSVLLAAVLRLLWGFMLMSVVGAGIYLVLFALRQSGVQRLSDIQTWPERK